MEVFWRKGHEGASLTDLTEAMGITRPSLYVAFGNKEALFPMALDRHQEMHLAYVTRAMEATTVREVVAQMLQGAVDAQSSDTQPAGCLAMANSMQGGDKSKSVREEIRRRAAEVRRMIIERFERAQNEGNLPPPCRSARTGGSYRVGDGRYRADGRGGRVGRTTACAGRKHARALARDHCAGRLKRPIRRTVRKRDRGWPAVGLALRDIVDDARGHVSRNAAVPSRGLVSFRKAPSPGKRRSPSGKTHSHRVRPTITRIASPR